MAVEKAKQMTLVQTTWQELREDLGLVVTADAEVQPETIPIEPVVGSSEEAALKAVIIELWQQHSKSEQELGPRLYELCKILHAPGRTGHGFDAWLKASQIPHSTAYRWIQKHCAREGLNLPYKKKEQSTAKNVEKKSKTLSQMGQGSEPVSVPDDTEADVVPVPTSAKQVIALIERGFAKLSVKDRLTEDIALRAWLDADIAQLEQTEPSTESAHANTTEQESVDAQ